MSQDDKYHYTVNLAGTGDRAEYDTDCGLITRTLGPFSTAVRVSVLD